jgi:hypothetical protein
LFHLFIHFLSIIAPSSKDDKITKCSECSQIYIITCCPFCKCGREKTKQIALK